MGSLSNIDKKILECDWKSSTFSRDASIPELPPGLNLKMMNQEKKTFTGNYALQVCLFSLF